jgi:molybdopterin-guanine dinucleotide biosynthesis protein B
MKIWGVVGWKNSGKTGLMERLVADLTVRGLRVSTIKHAHHAFDVDHAGKDSYRHRIAGAQEVLLASSQRWALMAELRGADEPSLEGLVAKLSPVDLVLVEGFKAGTHPKIEAFRKETGHALLQTNDPTIRAVATDTAIDVDVACFNLDDTATIASFILTELGD